MNPDLVTLKPKPDALAPDGSQIHRLARGNLTSVCQCVLSPQTVSKAIQHQSVEEIWLVLAGEGRVWRQGLQGNQPVAVRPGTSLVIPPRTPFQFQNTGRVALKIAIATSPPWPGDTEAVAATGPW